MQSRDTARDYNAQASVYTFVQRNTCVVLKDLSSSEMRERQKIKGYVCRVATGRLDFCCRANRVK